jgi:ABC-2 type transport system ATP-binding protein
MIEMDNLSKAFYVSIRDSGMKGAIKGLFQRKKKKIQALDNISFSIKKGELIGYIGPNGAGKSTTVKILSGILTPDSGECTVNCRIPWKQRKSHVKEIGVVFGQRTQLWWDLPVMESFNLLRDIYSIPNSEYKHTIDELIELLQIQNILDTPVRQMSLGQRMKCDIAASLLHSPEVVFLDEPTIGLDAVAKLAVRNFIKKINKTKKTTIILTTHDMDDIEALCSRILVIGKGKIMWDGRLSVLQKKILHQKHLIVDLFEPIKNISISGTEKIIVKNQQLRIIYDPQKYETKSLIQYIVEKYPVEDLSVENPPVDELIAKLYEQYIENPGE